MASEVSSYPATISTRRFTQLLCVFCLYYYNTIKFYLQPFELFLKGSANGQKLHIFIILVNDIFLSFIDQSSKTKVFIDRFNVHYLKS